MALALLVQTIVCIVVLVWLLKQKQGEPFSKKAVGIFLLGGACTSFLILAVPFPIGLETFSGLNPLLAGFLTALISAAILEEGLKYLFFRLGVRVTHQVATWHDAMIASVVVALGFTLLEDVVFAVVGGTSIVRAVLPMHLLFGMVMGYYYGKARVTKDVRYDVLSLVAPIALHTIYDMPIISLMAAVGDVATLDLSPAGMAALPYGDYIIPLTGVVLAVSIVTFVALVYALWKIGKWGRTGKKQELLTSEQ